MVAGLYEGLLEELGRALGLTLFPDENHSCMIRMPKTKLEVQIEMDHSGKRMMLGTYIGQLPPGRYRELVFAEALRMNGMPPPHVGVFAYSNKMDQLVMFRWIDLHDMSGEKIAKLLKPFAERGAQWRDAIAAGQVPVIEGLSLHEHSGMFGL